MGSMTQPILSTGAFSNQSIHQVVTTPRHPLGTRAQTPDGRAFRYASNTSTALVAGQLMQAEAIGANFTNINPSAAAAVGANSVALTLGGSETVALNAYEGGYLVVNDAAGEGITYRIGGNTAVTAGTAMTVTLDDEIAVALTTSSEVVVMKSPYASVVIAATGHVHHAVGVPQVAVPLGTSAAPQYFWIQTWGISAVWDNAATAVGAPLQSGTVAGQVEIGDGAGQLVGTQLVTGVSTEYRPKMLTLAP